MSTSSKEFPSFEYFVKAMETHYAYSVFADKVYEVLKYDNFENESISNNINMYINMLSYIFNDKNEHLYYFIYDNPILSDDYFTVIASDNITDKKYTINNITDLYHMLKDSSGDYTLLYCDTLQSVF